MPEHQQSNRANPPPTDNPPECIELHEIPTHSDNNDDEYQYAASVATLSSGENRVAPQSIRSQQTQRSHRRNGDADAKGICASIRRFWAKQIAPTVPQKSNRDHYAVERTFLAYIRTSVILSMLGVLVAQLFRLQQQSAQDPGRTDLTYYDVAIPLSVSCHCVALIVVVIGALRFWRQQGAITRGRVFAAGGWETGCVAGLVVGVVVAVLVLSVVVTVELA